MTENTFWVLFSSFVETVHVELTDEAVNFVVSEVFREHDLLKPADVFDNKLGSSWSPIDNLRKLLILNQIGLYVENLKGFGDEASNLILLYLLITIHVRL